MHKHININTVNKMHKHNNKNSDNRNLYVNIIDMNKPSDSHEQMVGISCFSMVAQIFVVYL